MQTLYTNIVDTITNDNSFTFSNCKIYNLQTLLYCRPSYTADPPILQTLLYCRPSYTADPPILQHKRHKSVPPPPQSQN